jgi:hypothetical protein
MQEMWKQSATSWQKKVGQIASSNQWPSLFKQWI